MTFLNQLKLLCWKNYISKKRNKVRLIIELLLPILLFLVLMCLRRIGDKKIFPDCYFKPKAMPSAGQLAFFQSFYCSLNNTCEDSTANASLSIFDNSIVSTIMYAIEEAFELASKKDMTSPEKMPSTNSTLNERFRQYINDIRRVIDDNDELSESDLADVIGSLNSSSSESNNKYTCGFNFNRRFSREATYLEDPGGTNGDNKTISDNKEKNGPSPVINFTIKDINNSTIFQTLDFAFCGPNVPGFAAQLRSLSGETESSWDRKKEEIESQSVSTSSSDLIFEKPEYENDTSEFCNNIMLSLDMSLDTRFVWRMFKPFLRGKIVYTPDAPVIRKMMNNINETFARFYQFFEELKTLNDLPGMRELNIIKDDDKFLRNLGATELGKDLLRLFNMKSDGDPADQKTFEQDVKSLRKLIANAANSYKRQFSDSQRTFSFETVEMLAECVDWSRIVPASDPVVAEKEALAWMEIERLWALIEFVGVLPNATKLPAAITYKIRTGIERTHATFQLRDRVYRPRVRRDPFIDLKHITGGWAYIQNLVDSEIIREQTGRERVPGIYLQQTPYPCHIKDMFRESITRTLPMFMIVSWIFLFSMLIKKIVWEKEKRITQTLRVMGVGKGPHWIAWFVDAFIPMFFVSFVLSLILVFGKIVSFSSFFLVWIFLITFILPTITLAFLVSTCFNRASIAAAVSGLFFLLIYLPYPPMSQFEERLDPNLKVFACLVSNIAFGLGCSWLANMEELAVGGHLSNMSVSPVPGNPISMTLILGMLLLDAVLYLLIALYIENVYPGGDGVGRPFYYPFTKQYWRPSSVISDSDTHRSPSDLDPNQHEPDPEGLVAGVSVSNLRKIYGNKVALDDLTINFYENQITSFLGHNGAGKSTSISIMTGLSAPTSGTVKLYGTVLNADFEIRNRDLGICSQENILLEDLTVEEQLLFYARVKGASEEKSEQDAYGIMKDIGILPKRYSQTKFLSGGTQRKVCVAIAFIGGSKVVFLDEPTAGVDPASRRVIWDLLIKYKKGRTVVLSTHFMDEADLLGDRIAIIAKGRLVCCGSPVFLKTKLGSGYYLTIDCISRSDAVGRNLRGSQNEESPFIKELTETLKKAVPDVKFLEQIGSEVTFVVSNQQNIEVFTKLFQLLEIEKEQQRIKSYGVSDTSLEEIFLKIAEESEAHDLENADEKEDICSCFTWKRPNYNPVNKQDVDANNLRIGANSVNLNETLDDNHAKLPNWKRIRLQLIALFIKRGLHHFRNYTALIVEIILPAVFIAMALYLSSLLPSIQKMPPLEVDVAAYAPSYTFYSLDVPDSPLLKAYERELLGTIGHGTKCVSTPQQCSNTTILMGSLEAPKGKEDTTPCPCQSGRYSCDRPSPTPPWAQLSNGDRIYNLTGQNITNWIIKTELEDSYIRYGGMTFGYQRVFNSIGLIELFQIFQLKTFLPALSLIVGDSTLEYLSYSAKEITSTLMNYCSKQVGESLLKNVDVNDNIIIWYNNRGWISGIAYMNAVSNLVLRASLPPGKNHSEYSIRLINHPLPITARQFEDEIDKQSNVSLLRALSVIWALAFIPATYAVYLIGERSSGLKHLQHISGVSKLNYWVANFIWDFLCFSLTIFVVVLIFLCYNEKAFVGRDSIGAFVLLLLSYAAVSIAFVYPISFLFEIQSSGFVAISTLNIFIGMFTLLTTFVLSLITNQENPFYLNTIFMIFPQFCLGKALLNMSVKSIRVRTLATFGVISTPTYLDWETSLQFITIMFSMAVGFFLLTLCIEYREILRRKHLSKKHWESYEDEDEDVKNERERVISRQARIEGDVLLLENISKWYKNETRPAVNKLCLGVKAGECFGLLGLNGAGKTTVFKMLTGSLRPSSGDASILGESIKHDGEELPLGYCPQTHALDPYLTPSEHLAFFSRLHGLTGSALNSSVNNNLCRLGLEIHQNKISSSLSGGNKRKLNTAIALVGNPRLVLLDEPTSGMDPRARRFLWHSVQTCVQEGRCVILTSHSMEECQNLCTRLSILVNGQFQCIGTCQHLKSKFDEGYSVVVRCTSNTTLPKVKTYLSTNLKKVGGFEINYLQVKLRLDPKSLLDNVFRVLDGAKAKKLIRDYSISQTTLEQIFIKFAKEQSQPSETIKDSFATKFRGACRNGNKKGNVAVRSPHSDIVIETVEDESSKSAPSSSPA